MKGYKFILTIDLDDAFMKNQHDVAAVLRNTADKLERFVSTQWSPYSATGDARDNDGRSVGTWEVKGPHDDNDE